jgi:glycosyltransferase involved in cell wall biosynthesis
MKVAFLIDKLDVGGTQRQLILLANSLAALPNTEVRVICLQHRGQLAAELSPKIQLAALGLRRAYGPTALREMRRLRVALRSWRCDVLHSFLPSANILGALVGRLTRIPAVVSRRDVGLYPSRAWQALEETVAYRLAARITCVSHEVANRLVASRPALRGKTLVIPNAVDVEAADRLAQSPGVATPQGDYVVTVGNIKPVKAYDFLLEAAPAFKSKVVVIGTGELGNVYRDLERMRGEVEALGLRDRVEFIGHRAPSDVAVIARRAIFAIHPSYSEGMSNAILEYMVHYNAVVCRDLPANRELIADGERGYLFSDLTDFAEKVRRLESDAALRERLAENARSYVCRNHGLMTLLETHQRTYSELCMQ